MKIFTVIIITLLFGVRVFAETCPKTRIEKGTSAPCTGYILSPEVIEEAARLPKQISLLEEKLRIKDDQMALKDEKIILYIDANDKKDVANIGLQNSLIAKDKNESLKLGLAIGGTALATALLCIGIAFAITSSYKITLAK